MAIDPWTKDSSASKRALDNARDVEQAALALLVDIQAGAFAGEDTTRPIDLALGYLQEAKKLAAERWAIYLNSIHEEAA